MDTNETIQVLAVTMNCTDPERLCEQLNLASSFVIGNQCDHNENLSYTFRGNKGLVISRDDRGVGNNRNVTLKYASADICLLSDDDMYFHQNYCETVKLVFDRHPEADVVIFNLGSGDATRRQNVKDKRIGFHNYMNYGAARIAFRRKAISYYSVAFNTNFGGGTSHAAGEDVLFLRECLTKGLVVVAVPESIATLREDRESTWFHGYDEKYFFDKGVFLAIAHSKMCRILAWLLILRHKEYVCQSQMTKRKVYKTIAKGISFVKSRDYYNV